MIPSQVTMVPRFLLYKALHIYNTHWALILPGMFTAFGTFLMRQFMVTIPWELNEAATIDGMGNLGILGRIIVPMVKPALVTLALISIVWSWNDYENAMLFLIRQNLYTIPLGLISFMDETGKQYSLIMAAAVSAVVPPMVLFVFGQRYFVEGLTAGAVKG
jgi:multiple sugar transport system permease protein